MGDTVGEAQQQHAVAPDGLGPQHERVADLRVEGPGRVGEHPVGFVVDRADHLAVERVGDFVDRVEVLVGQRRRHAGFLGDRLEAQGCPFGTEEHPGRSVEERGMPAVPAHALRRCGVAHARTLVTLAPVQRT